VFPQEENPRLKRIRFKLRAEGLDPDAGNRLRTGTHSRGYLPHVKCEGAAYFVTFRLADSLPREALLQFQAQRAERRSRLRDLRSVTQGVPTRQSPANAEEEIDLDYARQVERYLDKGAGGCALRQPEIAEMVADAIRHFEGERYRLRAWVVMPNHVHAVLWPMPNHLLGSIVKSWKGFTAHEANKLLRQTGQRLWQPEAFDRWVRNDDEMARICRYVENNPVTARLCQTPEQWRWSSAWPGWLSQSQGVSAPTL